MTDPIVTSDVQPFGGRIARRTTDLIVIAIILMAGLTVTQRLLVWWKTEPADVRADPEVLFSREALTPWGAGPEGVSIDLPGQALTLNRRMFQGTFDDAIFQLRNDCREVLLSDAAPVLPRAETESNLISTLMKYPTAEVDPNLGWSLHEIGSPLTMTIGVRRGETPDLPDRVVCWGLVLPLAEGVWSLLRVVPQWTESAAGPVELLPLPAECRPGLSVRDDLGGQLVTFTGEGPLAAWRLHFEEVARQRNWQPVTSWQYDERNDSAAWTTPAETAPQRIDIQLTLTSTGWTGLINISPTRRKEHP
ncbi:MAG: hypothetical protein ACK5Q5_16420 [Planctomycetaceae bacterium]